MKEAKRGALDKIRDELSNRIRKEIEGWNIKQTAAAYMLGLRQPDVCSLLSGQVERFSTERLIEIGERIGITVKMSVEYEYKGNKE